MIVAQVPGAQSQRDCGFEVGAATSISMTGYCSCREQSMVHCRVDFASRSNTHTILFRSMMIWQKCCFNWKQQSCFQRDEDWVFPNPATEKPLLGRKKSRRSTSNPPQKRLGWAPNRVGIHSDTHIGRSSTKTGAPMKVQQELMRHASIQTTMNVYGQALSSTKRQANSKVTFR